MIHTAQRRLARFAVVLSLLAIPITAAGCGAGTHYGVSVLAHKLANHFAKTPAEKRDVSRAFCVINVAQAFHNATHHHLIYGALSTAQAVKDCEAGFSKNAR